MEAFFVVDSLIHIMCFLRKKLARKLLTSFYLFNAEDYLFGLFL